MLTDDQKRLYARHVLLEQLGAGGQARLCAARATVAPLADARAAAVALDYLARAGVQTIEPGDDTSRLPPDCHEVAVGTPADVTRLAGDETLLECAAWLSGAFAAVEAIKAIAGVGSPGRLPPALFLNSEVS